MTEFVAARDTATHRVCGTCNELKSNKEFYKDGKDNKGETRYRRDCKDCYKRTRINEATMKEIKLKGKVKR